MQARIGKPLYGGSWRGLLNEADTGSLAVPFVLEGELVRITPPGARQSQSLPVAEPEEILQTSPDRIAARCRHFGVCGGCQYQHLPAGAQLRLKAELLRELLAGSGVALPAGGMQLHAAEPYGYRNRMRLRTEAGRLGYSRRGTNQFLPIIECPIVSPLLWRTAETLLHLVETGAAQWPAHTAEVELFATDTDDALQMSLHVDATVPTLDRNAPALFRSLCTVLQARLPQLRGAGLLAHAEVTTKPFGRTLTRIEERQRVQVAQWGEPALTYHVAGRAFRVSRGAFFQVNRYLTSRMVELAMGDRRGQLAMDLFAGAGLFSLPLTERFAQVVAVEVGEPAAADLAALLRQAGPQHHAERAATLDFLRRWPRGGGLPHAVQQRPDLILADPPRAGLGPGVVRELARVAPRELVYISCDPVTFSRDARALLQSGYAAAELHLLDLFPQSFHMETIAVFHPR